MIDELLTVGALGTLAVQVALVVIIANSLRHAAGLVARWVGLVVAFVVSGAVLVLSPPIDLESVIMAVFNAFLVYVTAWGGNEVANSLLVSDDTARAAGGRSWWAPWR